MRQMALASVGISILLLLPLVSAGQVVMPHSVVGRGGCRMSGANNTGHVTVGQTCIGVVSGPNTTHEIGFWYVLGHPYGDAVEEGLLPVRNWFGQNYPNPFNPVTTLEFAVVARTHVEMKVYDVAGREVATLVDRELDAGHHRTVLDGVGLPSGVYFVRMVAGEFIETRKLVLLK